MHSLRVTRQFGVLTQVGFSLIVIGLGLIAWADPISVPREVLLAAGYRGWWVLYIMLAAAAWWLLDWIFCIELSCKGWICVLDRWKPAAGLVMAFGWLLQAFAAAMQEVHAPGYMLTYLLYSIWICIALFIDATRKRERHDLPFAQA